MNDATAIATIFLIGVFVGLLIAGQSAEFTVASQREGISLRVTTNPALC